MEKLIKGFLTFRKKTFPKLQKKFKKLAEGQNPHILFFACCDSRMLPNVISSSEPGDMFVVRSVGNLIAPASPNGVSVGDVSEASALEYAVEVLGVKDIVICGHARCGAIRALIDGREKLRLTSPNLAEWLAHAEPAREHYQKMKFDARLTEDDRLSQANVVAQVRHLMTYPSVKRRLAAGTILIHAAWFDLTTGEIHYYDLEHRRFVVLDDASAEHLLAKRLSELSEPTA